MNKFCQPESSIYPLRDLSSIAIIWQHIPSFEVIIQPGESRKGPAQLTFQESIVFPPLASLDRPEVASVNLSVSIQRPTPTEERGTNINSRKHHE
jgi:hypothetical protein